MIAIISLVVVLVSILVASICMALNKVRVCESKEESNILIILRIIFEYIIMPVSSFVFTISSILYLIKWIF